MLARFVMCVVLSSATVACTAEDPEFVAVTDAVDAVTDAVDATTDGVADAPTPPEDTSGAPDSAPVKDTSGADTAPPDTGGPSGPAPQFREDSGYLVMEMESVAIGGQDWSEETELTGGNGTYYRYLGNNICNGPAGDALNYTFRVDTGGIWELRLFMARIWHCVEGLRHDPDDHVCQEGDGIKRGCEHLGDPIGDKCGMADGQELCLRKDLSNDVFIRIETDDGTFVPYTERTTDEDQVKLFGGGQNAFSWSGLNALDPAGAKRPARWDLPAGDYVLTVFGRSQGTRVDRLLFFHEGQSFNDGKAVTETLNKP